jgi:Zn-dependent M28 family amino/carboxypeptidase
MRAALVAGTVLAIAVVVALRHRPPGLEGEPAFDGIRAGDVAAHLEFLSSDALEGRGPASRGGRDAAAYLAVQLARMGVAPAGDAGTFLQQVPLIESRVRSAQLHIGGGRALSQPAEIVLATDHDAPRVEHRSDVVFVGFGIVAPEHGWDDYAGVDVRGKLVLALVGEPPTPSGSDAFDGAALSHYGRWTYKLEEAARRGAAGALLVHTDDAATYPWTVVQHSWSGEQYVLAAAPEAPGLLPRLLIKGWVREDAARALVARGGHALDALRRSARTPGAASRPLGVTVSATLEQQAQAVASVNVVGVLHGTEPAEAVVYTAHYDHLGVRDVRDGQTTGGDHIFNGAVDNASGVAGLLEVAGALARAPRPRRSIYFAFTTGEESGLAGATHFVAHPPVPVGSIAAAINLDTLNLSGRTHDAVLIGAERSSLGSAAAALAKHQGRVLEPDTDPGSGAYFRSDHYPFALAGVPAVALGMPSRFATPDPDAARRAQARWLAEHYHRPSDEFRPDFDYAGAVQDLHLAAMLGWRVASDLAMPVYHPGQPYGRVRRDGR